MCVCMCELPQHFVVVYGGKKCEGGMGSLNTSQNVCGLQALLQHFYLTNHIYMYIYLELNKAITFSKCLMCGQKGGPVGPPGHTLNILKKLWPC